MITDHVSHLSQYAALGRNFETAARFVAGLDLDAVAVGHYDVDGERVFANVVERDLVETPARWEFHRRYADIHLLLSGSETIGSTPMSRLSDPPAVDEAADCATLDGLTGVMVDLRPGEFVIVLPQDVHLPNVPGENGPRSKKMILKVLMEE